MTIVTGPRRKMSLVAAAKRMAGVAIVLLAAGGIARAAGDAADPYWFDENTGIAMGGYDPLAYVVDGKPRQGSAKFEYSLAGLTWRFVNPGNRDAFAEAVNVYAPEFGGYDPVALSRGILTQGNPLIWRRHEGRLLLFYSPAYLTLFEADPAGLLATARRNWPDLVRSAQRWPG